MNAHEETLKAQVMLAWIIFFTAGVMLVFVQDLFMVWPVTASVGYLGYRWGRIDEYRDQDHSIKIN